MSWSFIPYLLIVVLAFVIGVTAGLAWRHLRRSRPGADVPAETGDLRRAVSRYKTALEAKKAELGSVERDLDRLRATLARRERELAIAQGELMTAKASAASRERARHQDSPAGTAGGEVDERDAPASSG